jgi:hypothetical protein
MKVLVQIGRVNTKKYNQSINAYLNDLKLSWSDESGRFLTSHKDRVQRNMIWYMYSLDMGAEDTLTIDVQTFIPGVGKDDELTFQSLFSCDEDAPIKTEQISKVGMKGYPLVKGKLIELATVSEDDKRKQDIDDFLNEGFE